MSKAKKANKLSDASNVIELEVELDKLQLKGMWDFYNDAVGVVDKFEVTKSDCKLCMLMVHNNQEASYTWLTVLNLTGCVMMCPRFSNSPTVGLKVMDMRRKFISHL